MKKIIPQSKHELEAQGIRRVGSAWVWPIGDQRELPDEIVRKMPDHEKSG